MEELIIGQSRGQFAKSFREGDKFFILQLGSNTYSSFLLISELIHGCCKDSIVAEEIKERIKLHLFKIQILEIPARKVFKDGGSNLGRRFCQQ